MAARYDAIGRTYTATRGTDARIASRIWDARTVVNVGAGTGSYEPPDRDVTAVEPSAVMIAQRPAGAAPAVQASAEALPFDDGSFDAAMAVLTIHHWSDFPAGAAELRRVARDRVVVFSWDPACVDRMWLGPEYFPQLSREDADGFPSIADQAAALNAEVQVVPVPWDCRDGFMSAFWRRPDAYLDPTVRAGISTLAKRSEDELAGGLARLRADLDSGAWARRHADLLERDALDAGYRLLVGPGGRRHARRSGTRVRRVLSVPEGVRMPQPKSSRSSSSRARKPASKSAASKPAAKRTASKPASSRAAASKPAAKSAASKPAAKRAATKKPAAKRATASRASTTRATATKAAPAREEAVHANLSALRDTLRKGVVLTADGVKVTLDDAVKRGRITRKDATELSQSLLAAGRSQADGFRSDLEQLLGRGRDRAALSSDRVLKEVDRARRRVGVGPSFPITLYDELNATQIVSRLKDLTPAQLRKVRDHEKRNDNRKSVLSAIEKRLA